MNVYIWTDQWAPGSNTVAYYKFDGNMNDSSGNNRNLSVAQGTFTYGTLSQGAKYIQTNFNSYSSQISSFPLNSNSATISFWMSFVNGTAGNGNTSSTYGATVFDLEGSNNFIRPVLSWGYNDNYLTYGFSYLNVTEHYVPSVSESWHLYTAVLNEGTASIYIDGVLRKTGTYTVQNGYSFRLNTVDGDSTLRRKYSSRDKLSELIFENKQWTAQEVLDYYNQTKSNYIGGVYEYSYDFRNKSSNQLSADGWSVASGRLETSAYGITAPVDYDVTVGKPGLDLSNANKITITFTSVWNRNDNDGRYIQLGLINANYTSQNLTILVLGSGYSTSKVEVYTNGTRTDGTDLGNIGTSTYTSTFEVDLVNKTLTGTIPGLGVSTLSLTDAQVTMIRGLTNLTMYTTQHTFYLQDVSIKIEY